MDWNKRDNVLGGEMRGEVTGETERERERERKKIPIGNNGQDSEPSLDLSDREEGCEGGT